MIASLAMTLVLAGSSWAQFSPYQTPVRRPSFSPYLNLVRPGGPTLNYFGLVRPELEFRRDIGGLQMQTNTINEAVNNPNTAEQGIRPTGNSASFLNYSHFFNIRSNAPSPFNPTGAIGGPGSFGVARPTGPGSFGAARGTGPGSFSPAGATMRR
jgi:hypothetical protein